MRPFWYLRRNRQSIDSEIREELDLHLQMKLEELAARGFSPEEARREAQRQFGDVDFTRRYCRQQDLQKEKRMHRSLVLADIMQDARISLRSLLRAPALTLTIILSVGLGIGATTAIFSAVDAALLRPLPYAEPNRLVRMYTDAPPNRFRFSLVDYFALQAQQTHFEQVAAYTGRAVSYTDGTNAERVIAGEVSSTYFNVLGITPALGRDFTPADARVGAPPAAILTDGFWRRRLGANPQAVGMTIRIDGRPFTIVGVLPRATGPLEATRDLFIAGQWDTPRRKGPFFYTAIGRLKRDVSPASASDELHAINRRLFPIWKSSYQDDKATWKMLPLKDHVVGDIGTTVGLALAAVGLVWLIACANASNLLIARVTSRRKELAIRSALGASRTRIVRYLLVESSLLALASAAVGAAIAFAAVPLLQSFGASYLPRTQEIRIDRTALALLMALTAASAALFGLIPAFHGSGGPVDESLRTMGRSATGSLTAARLRRALVGAQFAIATPLLVVAALLLVSLDQLGRVDLGFDTRNLLTAGISLPAAQYRDNASVATFWNELQRRVEVLPGVQGLAFADGLPPNGVGNFNNFELEMRPSGANQSPPVTPWVAVSPGYFRLLGLPLLEGRLLEDRDGVGQFLESVVVDRAWARRFFPGGSALGKRFKEGGCTECPWTTVVGVVSEVKYAGLDQPDQGTVYTAIAGRSVPPADAPPMRQRAILVRTANDPTTLIASVRQAVREMDPGVPFSDVATMDELVSTSLEQPRSLSLLVGSLAAVALLLSVIGIYGVMAYYVQQQLKEISIRLALGATRRNVLSLVLRQGMTVVVGGLVIGMIVAVFAARWTASLLFGVGATDPGPLSMVSLLLLAVALAACLVPARRATTLQPASVLRSE